MVKVIGFLEKLAAKGSAKGEGLFRILDLSFTQRAGNGGQILLGTPILTMCPAGPSEYHIGNLLRIRNPTFQV